MNLKSNLYKLYKSVFGSTLKYHKTRCIFQKKTNVLHPFHSYMTLVTLTLDQGHQNLIIYYSPPNDVSVPVWSKFGHWFRRWGFHS